MKAKLSFFEPKNICGWASFTSTRIDSILRNESIFFQTTCQTEWRPLNGHYSAEECEQVNTPQPH